MRIEAELKTLLRICNAFGIYINVDNNNNSGNSVLIPSSQSIQRDRNVTNKWQLLQYSYIYGMLLTVLTLSLVGIALRKYEPGYMLTWLAATTIFITQMVAHLVIIFEALCKRRQHKKFLANLSELELTLKLCLKQDIAADTVVSNLRRKFVLLWIFCLICCVLFVMTTGDFAYFWYASLAIFAMRMRVIQLLMYLDLLRAFLCNLNRKLRQVVDCQQLGDVHSKRLRSIELLAAIKSAYSLLFESFALLNDLAGWSLATIVWSYVFDFTCHVYWTLLALDSIFPYYIYIEGIAALMPLGVFVCLLCYSSQECKQQSQLTASLLNKLVVNRRTCVGKRYRILVQRFITQLCQQRVELSARNFFNFDMKLIMSFCSTISTYLVILIQFFKSDESI